MPVRSNGACAVYGLIKKSNFKLMSGWQIECWRRNGAYVFRSLSKADKSYVTNWWPNDVVDGAEKRGWKMWKRRCVCVWFEECECAYSNWLLWWGNVSSRSWIQRTVDLCLVWHTLILLDLFPVGNDRWWIAVDLSLSESLGSINTPHLRNVELSCRELIS